MDKLRVFLADDHAVVREGLKSLVNAQPDMEVVGEADDGQTAVEEAQRLNPDVAVLDISMPRLNGAEVAQTLRQVCPQVRLVALTVHEEGSYLRKLLDAGATAYVLKRAAAEELIQAIRAAAAGATYLDPRVAGKVIAGFTCKLPTGQPPAVNALSDREGEVVRLIAYGYSNKEIAARLLLSVKTIETYKARSLEKLGLASRSDLVRYALEHGWMRDH
jgi:DNA-binding NarL/FixJ family response regulator